MPPRPRLRRPRRTRLPRSRPTASSSTRRRRSRPRSSPRSDFVRWQNYADMTDELMDGLVREAQDEARGAADAEGYFSAAIDDRGRPRHEAGNHHAHRDAGGAHADRDGANRRHRAGDRRRAARCRGHRETARRMEPRQRPGVPAGSVDRGEGAGAGNAAREPVCRGQDRCERSGDRSRRAHRRSFDRARERARVPLRPPGDSGSRQVRIRRSCRTTAHSGRATPIPMPRSNNSCVA